MKKSLLFAAMVFVSHYAFARELPATPFPNAQHTHQAEAKTWEVTPMIQSIFSQYRGTGTTGTNEVDIPLTVMGEYAFDDMFSVAAQVGYTSGSGTVTDCPSGATCPGPKKNGMSDPNLYGKFKADVGPGTVKAIVDLHFSFQDSNHTFSTGKNDSNAFSGSNGGNLAVAYEFLLGPGLAGAKLSYDVWQGNTKSKIDDGSTTQSITTRGGASFEAEVYYEYKYRKFTFGGLVNYTMAPETSTSTDGSAYLVDNDRTSSLGAGIYAPFLVGESIILYPEFDYTRNFHDIASNDKDTNIYKLSFNARFVF